MAWQAWSVWVCYGSVGSVRVLMGMAGEASSGESVQGESRQIRFGSAWSESDQGHHMEYRQGEDTKCDSYCPVSDFCPFARTKKADV